MPESDGKLMGKSETRISNAFQTFLTEAPAQAQVWMAAVQGLD
jgi:hypothetical protein